MLALDRQMASAGVVRLSGYPEICSARQLVFLWQNQHDRHMKHSFSILSVTAICVLALGPASEIRAQQPAGGQQLLAEAARRLDAETSIAAEVRYRVDAFGHQLLGTGNYLQSGAGGDRQLRLDLRMQVGNKPATLLEIRGPDYYWIRRDLPPSPPTLGRVDLAQFRRSLRRPDQPLADDALPRGAWIMLGGLPRLLTALDQSFEFAEPRSDEVQLSNGGQPARLPIWVLTGKWKPARVAALSGRESGQLPEQLPDRVEIVLDRSDKTLALFPYRISYWRSAEQKDKSSGDAPSRELLTLELFNVRRVGAIDPREFLYDAEDQEVLNLTAARTQQLGVVR